MLLTHGSTIVLDLPLQVLNMHFTAMARGIDPGLLRDCTGIAVPKAKTAILDQSWDFVAKLLGLRLG